MYGDALILDGVDFSVDAGETVGVVGRNGAGKTTLLLSAYFVPTVASGSIRVDGVPLKRRYRYGAASKGISLVPQERRIFPNLTVEENLVLGTAAKRQSGVWTLDSVYELFPNLARGSKRAGDALSGGEQQMLAIARGLLANPKVLLLDEPSEGLAPVIIDELVGALREIQSAGVALVIVEQRIKIVQDLADRFIALSKGRLVASGPVSELDDKRVQEIISI